MRDRRRRSAAASKSARLIVAASQIFAVILVFVGTAFGRQELTPARAYRFLDYSGAPPKTLTVQGITRRIIARQNETFTLPQLSAPAVLVFSVGLQPVEGDLSVRFVVELEKDDRRTPIYTKDVSTPGWVDERIELPEGGLGGARLSFSRGRLSGPVLGSRGGFGDPVLLWKSNEDRPSVMLISLDTLRADRVGLYGYHAARTPNLDALGLNGLWYRQAYSPATWTLPSHASLLWGTFLEAVPLEPRFVSLTETLRNAGYLTAGFTGGGWVSTALGFDRGFDTFYSYTQPPNPETCPPDRFDGTEVFERAAAWLRDRGQAPFFLFVHTYEAHDRCPFLKQPGGQLIVWDPLPPARHAELLAYYDDLIARTDGLLGAFLHRVETMGLSERTLVVVTSDHGEAFSEHGERGHGDTMQPFEEVTRVPLLFRNPKKLPSGKRIDDPVSLIDVAPTILALVGLPPPPSMTGDVLPGISKSGPARPVYVVTKSALAVRYGDLKLIRSNDGKTPDRIYDLASDPGERKNLDTADPERFSELRRLAIAFLDRHGGATPQPDRRPDLDPQTKERLRALGYAE